MKRHPLNKWIDYRPVLLGVVGVVAFTVTARATIITADRTIDWTQCGVPGGIPNRTTIGTTATTGYGAVGDDATDNKAALQAAFNATPAGTVCMIPAGTYRVNGTLTVPSNITIRGAGVGQTIIKPVGTGAGLFQFGTSEVGYTQPGTTSIVINSGATKGSTSIAVTSASGMTVGSFLVISEVNDPTYVVIAASQSAATWVDGWSTSGTRARGQIVQVTAVSGTTVTFAPALFSNYGTATGTSPAWATKFTAGCTSSGVENLTVYATNSGTMRNFLFQEAAFCWVYNCYCDFADGDQCTLDFSYRCEVRKCYFNDAFIHASGNYDNMVGLRYKTSGTLVVDNIIERLHVGVMCEWGASGNVIGYNYVFGEYDDGAASGNRWMPNSMIANHGAHPQFNLFEGNIAQKMTSDSYWGSASHTTIFRNWFIGHATTYPPYSARGTPGATVILNQDNKCVDLWEIQTKFSVVGNILGDSTTSHYTYKTINPATRSYTGTYVWSLGYITSADTGGTATLVNPSVTLIDHGNFDYVHGVVQWDPTISDHVIPNSFFLTSKPVWFGSLPWPAFDPTNPNPSTDSIPASYRRIHGGSGSAAFGVDAPGVAPPTPPTGATVKIQTS